jgi:hypothetical protein
VATKQELADSLTADQLRDLAEREGVDVTGARSKTDLVNLVSAGLPKAVLQAEVEGEPAAREEAVMAEEEKEGAVPQERISPADTEGLAKAGRSPADLELRLPQRAAGEPRVVKASPEMPSLEQIEAATSEEAGPPKVEVTVTDAAGETVSQRVRPDDAAQIAQRTASAQAEHPAHTSAGAWSNPDLVEWTDEEKEADAEAYKARVS